MSVREVIWAALLATGTIVVVMACVGVVVARGPYARLHYLAPSSVGAVLLAAAVLVREGFSLIADKGLLVAAFLVVTGPVLAHVTARAARIRERGDLEVERR